MIEIYFSYMLANFYLVYNVRDFISQFYKNTNLTKLAFFVFVILMIVAIKDNNDNKIGAYSTIILVAS